MSKVFSGYFSCKLHTFKTISAEASYKLQGESDRKKASRDLAVAGLHPGHLDRH
jgi:hypothetical protein